MKSVLEHVKNQTIPHEILEDLHAGGVKFYESCLIVQIKDHRSINGPGKPTSSDADSSDFNKPFSIHNYSKFVTPSSYVDYPEQKEQVSEQTHGKNGPTATEISVDSSKDKQNSKDLEPKTYTVVLFPTPLSIAEDVMIQANTPEIRPGNRKQSHVPRTPASATVPHTPLTAGPTTPSTSGPAAKRQKMSVTGDEILEFESRLIAANAPPLFLEPTDSLKEFEQILEKVTDALHSKDYPAPKSRKRTVAELAADEAQAASDQAFMLIMDERLAPAVSASGLKANNTDEAGTASFEPTFEKFNAIQAIKARREQMAHEKAVQEAEAKRNKERHEAERARQEAENQVQQAQQQQQQQQQAAAQAQANRLAQLRAEHARRQAMASHEMQRAQALAAHNQQNGIPINQNAMQQPQVSGMQTNGVPQPQHASPVVRNSTPHSHASPMLGDANTAQPAAVPMNVTSSGQGGPASSPTRPSSAMQQTPANSAMARQSSRQQITSRTGTPMVNGTPNMVHATPNLGQVTPIPPHAGQESPPNQVMQTPMMNNTNLVGHPRMTGSNGARPQFTPQQMAELQRQQQQQAFLQRQAQNQLQNSPTQQMTPERRQALQNFALQNQHLQYQRSLAQHHATSIPQSGVHGHPQMPNGINQQGHLNQQQGHQMNHPQMAQQRQPLNPAAQQRAAIQHRLMQSEVVRIANSKYGGQVAMMTAEDRMLATQNANQQLQNYIISERHKHQQAQQQIRQQQQIMAAQMQSGVSPGGNPNMGRGQGLTPQQQQQMMVQMAQMAQVNGQGMQNMNMGGMNGLNGMGGNGMGNGMNGMQ